MPLPKRLDLRATRRFAITVALSAAGGALFAFLGIPAGWISGGLLAVAVASLAGVNTDVPMGVRPVVYLVLGIYAGGGVTPETLHQMQTWPASFALLGLSLVALIASSYWWLHGRCGWGPNTALLASLPGALSVVMAAAEGLKADVKKVAISQTVRLLILAELIPLVALFIGHPPPLPPAAPISVDMLGGIAVLVVCGAAAGLALTLLNVVGGWMLGGLFSTALLLLFGIVESRLSFTMSLPFVIVLSAIAGSRFRPGDLAILPMLIKPAFVAFTLALGVSVLFAGLVTLFFGVNFIQTLLAFAPGALDTLVVIALQMNIDPAYVAAHHVARLIALMLIVPIVARWLSRGAMADRDESG